MLYCPGKNWLKLMPRFSFNKKILKYFLIFIPPLLYVLFAYTFSQVRGPFYLGSNIDPTYAYLFNSLSVSQGLPVGHIDHPGTPIQSLGALVINFITFINRQPNTIYEVLKNPEFFLNSIYIVIVVVNFISLLGLGLISYRLTKKLWITLLLEITPFFSINILAGNLMVMPEPILLTASLLLILSLTILFFSDKHLKLILLLSISAIGLGIASKIIFFPLLFIPLFSLPTVRAKICFILGSAFSFYLFTIPIVPFYSDLFAWIKALFLHSGRHGQGETAIINTSTYFANILDIFKSEPIFSVILFIAIIILIFVFLVLINSNSPVSKKNAQKKQMAVLFSLIFAQIFQVLLVSKHPGSQYLVPALCLSSFTLVITISSLPGLFPFFPVLKNIKLLLLVMYFAFILVIYQILQIGDLYFRIEKNNSEIISINKIVEEKYSKDIVISYFRSSSKFYAMRFGNTFARDAYTSYLTNIYPDVYFWDIWNARFSDWSSRIVNIDEIIKKQDGKKIIFHGTSFSRGYADTPNYKPKLLMEDLINGNEETVYQVITGNP